MTPLPLVLTAALAMAPLDAGQQARLAAWLQWASAYRDCYEPAPFSLRIDKTFTARCIEQALRRGERAGSTAERAAADALIRATPRLIDLVNAPAVGAGSGRKAAGIDSPPLRSRR